MTLQIIVSDSDSASMGTQELESHLVGDDVLEEISLLHYRTAPIPIAPHHLSPSSIPSGPGIGLGQV